MKKTLGKMEMMLLSSRMILVLLAVLLFTGLTACDQAKNAKDVATEVEEQEKEEADD